MSIQLDKIMARRPRFQVIADAELRVFKKSRGDESTRDIRGILLNISRTGMRIRIPEHLEKGDSLVLQLDHLESGLQIRVPALVCWSRESEDGQTDVGCQLENKIAWEAMGELFLNAIISSSQDAS